MPVYKDKPTKDGRQYYFSYSWIDNNGEKKRYKSKKYKEKRDCVKYKTPPYVAHTWVVT